MEIIQVILTSLFSVAVLFIIANKYFIFRIFYDCVVQLIDKYTKKIKK